MKEKKDKKLRWLKNGGGTFRAIIDGQRRIIKPNEKFSAYEHEIPASFRDSIVCLDKIPSPDTERLKSEPVRKEYTLQAKGVGWYNIIDSEGKVLNEKALRQQEAKEMLESLQ